MSGTCRILSIDGGGIRGVLPATILVELEKRLGAPLARHFHLLAGTSTGGILACGLAHEVPAEKLLNLYAKDGGKIFTTTWSDGIDGPRYDAGPLETELRNVFAETRLGALPHDVLCPAYNLQTRRAHIFRSWLARGVESKTPLGDDFLVREVARCTAAAPTYFAPATATASDGSAYPLIDGGMLANDPAMLAYVSARRLMPLASRFLVLSVGTGQQGLTPIPYEDAVGWGFVGWAPKIVDILFDAVGDATSYELDQMSNVDHIRWQPPLAGASDALDDASANNIAALGKAAQAFLQGRSADVERVLAQLRAPLPDRLGMGYPKATDIPRPLKFNHFPRIWLPLRLRAARHWAGTWATTGGALGGILGATMILGGPVGLAAGALVGALGGEGIRRLAQRGKG